MDPEYSEAAFWGVISDFGEGSGQWGPYKFLVTRALVKHATLGDADRTVKVKIGQESEGNLYLMGFSHLSECVGRSIKFLRKSGKIDGDERMWFVAIKAKQITVEKSKKK